MNQIEKNLEEVRRRLQQAAARSGRSADGITLVAVSKKVPVEKIRIAFECGVRDFGENYIQESEGKIGHLQEANWHFIGHLQKNKAKTAAMQGFRLIQSLDSVELAEKLNRAAVELQIKIPLLMQIHYGEETSKHGFLPGEAEKALKAVRELPNIEIRGFMTIPPLENVPETNRPYFRHMSRMARELLENPVISMGMTDDFEIAVEEGSTMVRVGRAIFGQRK